MIVYLDSSVILRFLFHQEGYLDSWGEWERALTSELSYIEGLRTIDRSRLERKLNDIEVARTVQGLRNILEMTEEIVLDRPILRKAAQSFPTVLGTLDSLHLASAFLWCESSARELTFLTHDAQQGRGAQAIGLKADGF